MECPICNVEWIAIYPMSWDTLTCPRCGYVVRIDEHEVE